MPSIRSIALFAIRLYQRFISPHKGFCCAYRTHTGRASCSQLGYRAIRRHGVFVGIAILRRRTWLCGVVYRRYAAKPLPQIAYQRGFCDGGCDLPCDFSCDGMGDIFNSCGSCDLGSSKKENRKGKNEQQAYVPPTQG